MRAITKRHMKALYSNSLSVYMCRYIDSLETHTTSICLSSSLFQAIFKTVLSSGYILILLSIEYILACLIEMCQG